MSTHFGYSLVSVVADFISAILIRATGRALVTAHGHNLKSLGLTKRFNNIGDTT